MPKHLSSLATAIIGISIGFSAAGAAETPAVSSGERAFALGFTPFPWDATPEAVRDTGEFIVKEGDLITHHFDDGVPWTEALEGKPLPPALAADWKRRQEMSKGKKVLLALTPLDGGRKGLALYRGEKENQPLPERFRGKSFDDPDVRAAYLAYCERAIEAFHPDWLAIGIEVNELILNTPADWPKFLDLYRKTRAALKEKHPRLPIFATVTLHALFDPPKRTKNGQEEKVRAFFAECDVAALSYHPFMMGNMTHPEEPLDRFRSFTDKPIAIAESSFPAETLTLDTFHLTLPSTPELQAAFVEKLLDRAQRDRYLFVTWFLHRDYDRLWEKLKATAPEFFKAWRDCGLLDGEGAERPALAVWRKWLATPLRKDGPEPPRVEHAGLVAPDILGITVCAGRSEYGRQVPYVKQPGDFVSPTDIHRFVARGGKVIGTLVGKAGDVLCTMDEVVGERLDAAWADRPASYEVSSPDDPRYASSVHPKEVCRKTKPSDLAMIGPYKFDSPTESVIYLKLPAPLAAGKTYLVSFADGKLPAQRFRFDPAALRSEAVHVNQIGFRPDDPAKVAFLSSWLGDGGPLAYEAGMPFAVVDDATGETVLEGRTALSKAAGDKTEDSYGKNYNGVDVFAMDFSALSRPGVYRVVVPAIGCSDPFPVRDDAWRAAFFVAARGFYHQRSGIPLGPPYTSFIRPRPFHPDDGLKVFASKAPLIDTGNGLNQKDTNFGNLVKGKTEEIVPDAWGGYMDAGDWDRRVQHLKVTRLLLELAELFPDYFAKVSLNIPESGNGLPDVVNEALFNLDCYRRLQTPAGGVRGGIESSEHPRRGEASYQESLEVMAYAPDAFSSYVYAGAAAQAAGCLESMSPERAAVYRESALRAMEWAEGDREREEKEFIMGKHPAVRDVRAHAAAELFRLTGEARWNEIFLAATLYRDAPGPIPFNWDSLDQGDSAWVYARTDRPGADEKAKRNCRDALLREADERVASVERTAFHWAKHPWGPVVYGALSSPEAAVSVARAHALTGDRKYLRALVLASCTGAGANPLNLCYTTGVGRRWPKHPLQIDHRITRQEAPPGLTVGGPMDSTMNGLKDPFIGPFAGGFFHPLYERWPAIEAFWDVFWDPMECEYTVHKPMAGTAYVWGYLAARKS